MREWYKPLSEWNSYCCMEFMSWVAKYSEGNPDLKLEEAVAAFRMVMDTGYCEEPETNPYTDALAHSMLHTKEVLAAGIMNKVFKEVYEEHGKALLNEHNQFGF